MSVNMMNFASLLEAAPDAMLGTDQAGVIRFVNRQTELLFDYDRVDLVGQPLEILVPESVRKGHLAHRVRYFADPAGTRKIGDVQTVTGRRRDGTEFPADVSLSFIETEDGLFVTAAIRDISKRIKTEQELQQMAAIVRNSDDAITSMTLDGIVSSWNPAAERMFGYSSAEVIGKSIDIITVDDRPGEIGAILATIGAGQPVEHYETIRVRKDGTTLPVSITVSPIHDADGVVVGASTFTRDVTKLRRAAETARDLAAAEDMVRTLMANTLIGVILADLDSSFQAVNDYFSALVGYDEEYILARRLPDFVHPDDADDAIQARARVIAGESTMAPGLLRLVRADGATIWVRRVTVLLRNMSAGADRIMVLVEDATAEHEAQEALAYQAFHDPLTGMHNRAWILDILEVDLRIAKREGRSVVALFVDLDNFKVVNDSLGHVAGDEVLVIVAGRIVAAVRAGDRVGRFGGNEFVILIQNAHNALAVERYADRVSAAIGVDLQVRGHRIVPTASIGIAISTSTSTAESLLRDADAALSHAKTNGRARWHFFDETMHAEALARLTVEDQLREAITASQFVVFYQPIVALADAHVVGHEALVRWAHPTRGLLSPGEFLDVAEHTGLITAIGVQVLDQVCAMLAEHPDLPGPISVNVSAVQLAAPGWLTSVRDTLATHRVDPARIVIEVTETAVLSLVDSARAALTSLRELGVGIHLDDFGTGYSSISVLLDLPVTGVKLDLRFVHDLTESDSQANALAQGVNGLVKGMHLTGIAEGIETQMQADILRDQGWEHGQGYYFGKPATTPPTH